MIAPGTILIDGNAGHPACFQLEDDSFPNAWLAVTHKLTPRALEDELWTAGWTFFYMAHAIKATSFGFDHASMVQSALQHVISDVRRQKCNCLEIDAVASHSFFGLRYVNVYAHARHIQKGVVFSGN